MHIAVIGAGLSGLMAAQELTKAHHSVKVFDKGRGVGGRLATRRIDNAVLDHGAQFFTVRSAEFSGHVDAWLQAGVVREWCQGFGEQDGHPRYVGTQGMSSVAKHLAASLVVQVNCTAISVMPTSSGVTVTFNDATTHSCDAVIITSPIPQTIALLAQTDIEIPQQLHTLEYDCTLGLLAVLDSSSHNVPSPGGLQNPDDTFSFIGDNMAKGISPIPAITFHANPQWSQLHFDLELDHIHHLLTQAAQPWLGSAEIVSSQAKKWRYATPQQPWADPFWKAPHAPVFLAGDAFAGPKIEGAALSGLATARALLSA